MLTPETSPARGPSLNALRARTADKPRPRLDGDGTRTLPRNRGRQGGSCAQLESFTKQSTWQASAHGCSRSRALTVAADKDPTAQTVYVTRSRILHDTWQRWGGVQTRERRDTHGSGRRSRCNGVRLAFGWSHPRRRVR